ncbi:hypothetical protein [Moraxella nasicaprae]|uniref:Uncharacterized protein n=1 Tax=Moraxella nasicaprae TaxID=2904122 RepID=A0ABY6F6B9_9GAMM|nr:hypothetical protein [Moraxella nasicaprae]UXZ05649.1 hypothetical protein LU297_04195 [Moraxella nasicaprae]
MSTASFDKQFIVRDEKAIEEFLYDLENAKPVQIKSPKKEQPSVDEFLEILQKRWDKK